MAKRDSLLWTRVKVKFENSKPKPPSAPTGPVLVQYAYDQDHASCTTLYASLHKSSERFPISLLVSYHPLPCSYKIATSRTESPK